MLARSCPSVHAERVAVRLSLQFVPAGRASPEALRPSRAPAPGREARPPAARPSRPCSPGSPAREGCSPRGSTAASSPDGSAPAARRPRRPWRHPASRPAGRCRARPDRHPPLAPRPGGSQPVGQAVGPAVELAIANGAIDAARRDSLGPGRGLLLEETLDPELAPAASGRGGGPLGEELMALGGVQQRQRGEPAAGIVRHPVEQPLEVSEHAQRRRGVEEVGVELEGARRAPRRSARRTGPGRRPALPRSTRPPPRPRAPAGPAGAPAPTADRSSTWKRGLRLSVRSGWSAATSFSKGSSRFSWASRTACRVCSSSRRNVEVRGEPGAQDQGVEEEADQAFELHPAAVIDGGARQVVLLPAVAVEHDHEGRQEDHELGDPQTGAEVAQGAAQGAPARGGARGHPGSPTAGRGRSVGSSSEVGAPASCRRQ